MKVCSLKLGLICVYLWCVLVLMAPPAPTPRTENPPRNDVQDRGQRQGAAGGVVVVGGGQVQARGEEEEEGGEGEAEGEKDGAQPLTG